MEGMGQLMEGVAKGLITEEEMNERLAFAMAKWRTAQAEIARLRDENLRLRDYLVMTEELRLPTGDDEKSAKK